MASSPSSTWKVDCPTKMMAKTASRSAPNFICSSRHDRGRALGTELQDRHRALGQVLVHDHLVVDLGQDALHRLEVEPLTCHPLGLAELGVDGVELLRVTVGPEHPLSLYPSASRSILRASPRALGIKSAW